MIACNKGSLSPGDCKGELIEGYCYGCTDPNACNWDPTASRFDDSCTYIPEGACDCDGNVEDECSVCGGSGAIYQCGCTDIPEGDCDCDGNVEDCTGECSGNNELDECGICGGNGIPDGACDCNGSVFDCAGECGGSAVLDACGVCGGDGSGC